MQRGVEEELEGYRKNENTWKVQFAYNEKDPLLNCRKRRMMLYLLSRSLSLSKDESLVLFLVNEEISFFVNEHFKLHKRELDMGYDPNCSEIRAFIEQQAPLSFCCFLLSRFHKLENVWQIWRAISVSAKHMRYPVDPKYLYLGGSSQDKSFKETINYIKSNKIPATLFKHNRKEEEENLLKQVTLDEQRFNQDIIQQFWDNNKNKPWKLENFVETRLAQVELEKFNRTALLTEVLENPSKWETLLSYRHELTSKEDINIYRRLAVMVKLSRKVNEEGAQQYEDLINYLFDQECLCQEESRGISGALHLSAYLLCRLQKIENIFKIWRSKCANGNACFVQHADFLYVVGKTPDSKNSAKESVEFVKGCDEKLYPTKESLLKRIDYDEWWLTQQWIDTFWQKRLKKVWDLELLLDGGWG